MDIKTVNISEEYGLGGCATLKCFLHEGGQEMQQYNHDLPAVVIAPGGGYGFVSKREGDPIAVKYFSKHYNAFVLTYSIAPARYPLSLMQLASAVDYVKTHAAEMNINPERVSVVGFSAGAHLVGSLAALCDNLPEKTAKGGKLDARPAAVVMAYPVINYECHPDSFKNLLGITERTAEAEKLELDRIVTPAHPPTFIWGTARDRLVHYAPAFAAKLMQNGVKTELHIFPDGGHGSSTCDENTLNATQSAVLAPAAIWFELSDRFLKSI